MSGGIETRRDDIRKLEWTAAFHDFMPAAGNSRVKQTERDQGTPNHDRGLNQIGPDDGLDSTEGSVNGGENNDGNRSAEVNPESLNLIWSSAADHLVGQGQRNGCDVKPRAGGEQTRDHENGGSGVLACDSKARGQVFVDRENSVVVIRLD